ncbi:MAG TPA: hypothetical protein VFD50_01805, partial [Thermoleophilia bacterium]|nr:hypothetical protein [Thermoleophilia bacterium]
MSIAELLAVAITVLLVGAVASLALARWRRLAGWVSTAFVAAAAVAIWVVVLRAFSSPAEGEATVLVLPGLGARLSVVV